MITADQLHFIMPHASKSKIDLFVNAVNEAMRDFEINTRVRVCAFLSQIAHESCSLLYVQELASGKAYEGRVNLGNTQKGDGVKFKGRGLIQITGRTNYQDCSKALGLNLIDKPELLELPEWAVKSAAWFWKTHGLNEIADKGDIKAITKRVNGGYNGLQERTEFYLRALQIIK